MNDGHSSEAQALAANPIALARTLDALRAQNAELLAALREMVNASACREMEYSLNRPTVAGITRVFDAANNANAAIAKADGGK